MEVKYYTYATLENFKISAACFKGTYTYQNTRKCSLNIIVKFDGCHRQQVLSFKHSNWLLVKFDCRLVNSSSYNLIFRT